MQHRTRSRRLSRFWRVVANHKQRTNELSASERRLTTRCVESATETRIFWRQQKKRWGAESCRELVQPTRSFPFPMADSNQYIKLSSTAFMKLTKAGQCRRDKRGWRGRTPDQGHVRLSGERTTFVLSVTAKGSFCHLCAPCNSRKQIDAFVRTTAQ